jgi:hypothetical protein
VNSNLEAQKAAEALDHSTSALAQADSLGSDCVDAAHIGCAECAWGKVAGCWRCGSRVTPIAPRRVVRAAAVLAERYLNGDVAAYGRLHFAEGRMWSGKFRRATASERRDQFWFSVGRALGAAYGRRGCPTDYERAMRRAIDSARELIAAGA